MKATGRQAEPFWHILSRVALPVARCGWLILMSTICVADSAVQQDYQTGKLIKILDRKIDVGMPTMLHLAYVLQIQAGDSTYSVYIDKRSYDLEWIVGNSIQFRIEKKNIFLRRLNGKELKAKLLGVAVAPPGTPLPDVPSTVPPRELLLTAPKHHRTIPMGDDFLRGNNMCVGVSATIDLALVHGSAGKSLRKESRKGGMFPERTMVRVLLYMHPCAPKDLDFYLGGDELRPDFHFDDDFIQALRFEGFWKNGFETKTADLRVLTEAQVKLPSPLSILARDASWWEYELDVQRMNVPQTDALIVNVLSPDGRLISRFSYKP